VVVRHFGGNYAGKSAYEMSTYGALYDFLGANFAPFFSSEYFPGEPPGALVGAIRNEDATHLTFADESLDLVTSNQVFEHIEQDVAAFAEAYRVLRPGGALIFTIPLYDTATTLQLARTSATGELQWLGTPEYHDSRTTGPMSAPVFWRHSRSDIVARVQRGGFAFVTVEDVRLLPSQETGQPVLYARKA
jgi:SAM-dependent methyltransferase